MPPAFEYPAPGSNDDRTARDLLREERGCPHRVPGCRAWPSRPRRRTWFHLAPRVVVGAPRCRALPGTSRVVLARHSLRQARHRAVGPYVGDPDTRAADGRRTRRHGCSGFSPRSGPMSLLFAATHPERTIALVLYGSYARRAWAPDHPYGVRPEDAERLVERIEKGWGRPGTMSDIYSPSADESYRQWGATWNRLAASPGAAIAILRMNMDIDVRHVLPTIRVPTLVAHRIDERVSSVGQARYLATHIAGAELAEFPGIDHTPWIGDADAILDRIERFLTGVHDAAEHDRVLATILFLDIVGSTERAANFGDRRWRELLDQ